MKELVLVECISTFRTRYVVELPIGKKDWALDSVVMEEVDLMSQQHIGENIVSHRVISKEEYMHMFDQDNPHLSNWTPEQKNKYIKKYSDET